MEKYNFQVKKLIVPIFGAIALTMSAAGNAATYNFLAEGNAEEAGYSSFVTGTDDHIGMAAGLIATASVSGASAYAYLDRGDAGLGVCGALDSSAQCTPSSDDNVDISEGIDVLHLAFTSIANLSGISFTGIVGGFHGEMDSNALVDYKVDGGAWETAPAGALSAGLGLLTTLDLRVNVGGGQDFYVASLTAVPVPAAVWLFGTALAGLIGFGRRKETKAGTFAA